MMQLLAVVAGSVTFAVIFYIACVCLDAWLPEADR